MRILALLLCLAVPGFAQQAEIAEKAEYFLSLLNADLQAQTRFNFNDDERFNWHFVPRERKGISFHSFTPQQRDAALALLKVSLSSQGYQKTTAIIELENILREIEGRGANDTYRDPQNYYFTLFGAPRKDGVWSWRIEGHHIAFNFIVDKGVIVSSTPSFLGSNPAIVPTTRDRGKQVLKQETELGFSLVNSLTQPQLQTALIAEKALSEIVSYNSRKAEPLTPEGLKFTSMSKEQQEIFLQLLETYVKNYELGFSDKLMAKIKEAGIKNLSFAWAGSLKPGVGHYYRIQGPTLLIEYDNTQNKANHVHTVVRDLTNDFGEDILREHYEKEHK